MAVRKGNDSVWIGLYICANPHPYSVNPHPAWIDESLFSYQNLEDSTFASGVNDSEFLKPYGEACLFHLLVLLVVVIKWRVKPNGLS